MASYVILDLETTIKESYKRKANCFDEDNRIVASGLKYKNRDPINYYEEKIADGWLDGIDMIVCHNAAFDLLWMWNNPHIKVFLKRGGKVFCTQFAEYLLSGQNKMYASLDYCAEKYGGELKNDEIKEMWNAGIDTPDIPQDMILDYLDGDVKNTEIVFLAQVQKARKLSMLKTLHTHMEGLLCIIEMMHNGMYVDIKKALRQKKVLEDRLAESIEMLHGYIPTDLPPEIEWNWASKDHLSALFFGGNLKYKRRMHTQDEEGNYLYTKATEKRPTINGIPVIESEHDSSEFDIFKSGKKAGAIKYKNVKVQGEPKMRYEEFFHPVCRLYTPKEEWATKKEGVYKTDADVLKLIEEEVHAAELMQTWRQVDKDLGTYYSRYEPKKDTDVGMLTLVKPNGIINHMLNTVSTVTGRLSSSNPNMQNVSSGDKSKIKSCFTSRWGTEGRMGQIDFSQLEVIVKAFLSQDQAMIEDIKNKVDFHVKRLAFKLGESYEDVFHKCKVLELPEYVEMRKKVKPISFQKAYGAGVGGIAASLGLDKKEVKAFCDAEDALYPEVVTYDNDVHEEVLSNRTVTKKTAEVDGIDINLAVGWHVSPTGKRYVFHEIVAPPFMRKKSWNNPKPVLANFMNTQTKNYPTQGFAGEIVYLVLGHMFREFLARDNFDGKALLVNTVHDSIWSDSHESVALEANRLIRDCCEKAPQYYEERYGMECNVPFAADLEIGAHMLDLWTVGDHFTSLGEFELWVGEEKLKRQQKKL